MAWLLPPLPPTFEAALRDVRARSAEARAAAGERLAEPEPGNAERALEGLLVLASDGQASVRAAAIRGLKQLGREDAMACLLERLDDSDALVRELSVVAIGAIGGPRAEAVLLRALRSPHPEVRFQAVASYVESCEPDDAGAVVPLLRDPDPKVRGNAARSLSRFSAHAHDDLRRALTDDDGQVRSEAALALARSGDASGVAGLRTALGDPELVVEALDAIGGLGLRELSGEAAAIAQAVLKPLGLKVAAARALLRLGDARGTRALREVLRAFRSDARSSAVQVVGELRIGELAGELQRLALRPRGVDPETLVDALAALLPDSEQARVGLQTLARRLDPAGERARVALGQS
jgi:HEAT repeat protein